MCSCRSDRLSCQALTFGEQDIASVTATLMSGLKVFVHSFVERWEPNIIDYGYLT
jgi:hypothetical protein